ncbi:MAG: helix-turn-helix domain-containing protein [Gammaproteobacteria bacterium]|nr:helix-turn-helix domain-containing protein [Gammaproteobacteria bacterium]
MKTRSTLKRKRLGAGMTQAEVAEAMGVSQPNYQRWESGSAPIPSAKVKKLARILKTTADEILGKKPAFDLLGIDDNVGDARKYFGETAIHFASGGALLLPISEEVRSSLHHQFQSESAFIIAESLDNRLVYIRREAVTDVYFSSEAYDTYGPEEYTDHMGVLPDDDFWQIVEHMNFPDSLEEEVDEARIDEVLRQVCLTAEDLDKLVASGDISAEDREKVKKEAAEKTQKFFDRATSISWQLSSGKVRCESAVESSVVFEAFSLIETDPDDIDDVIYLPVEGYHRTVMIRKPEIQYIWVPKHMYNEGAMESAEEELDTP